MHRCHIVLQAADAACGEFLGAVGCKRLSLTHYPAESVHTDVLTVREELEQCPEELSHWLLEPGLKYLVAKNFLGVDVTEVGDYGYTMSNARVQMLSLGRNHICSVDTAEHNS